jgi:hypothetical protein
MNKDMLKEVIVVFVTIVFTMAGYWLMIGREFVTRAEAANMVLDNQKIFQLQIDVLTDQRKDITTALKENTIAINELRVTLAKITHDKP